MAHSKFNKFGFLTVAAALALVGLQGCGDDEQDAPVNVAGKSSTAGAAGKAGGVSNGGSDEEAGASSGGSGNTGNNGGTGNVVNDAGAGGEAGAPVNPECVDGADGFLVPCDGEGTCTVGSFDNKKLTKIKNGVLPALP